LVTQAAMAVLARGDIELVGQFVHMDAPVNAEYVP
jgi:hypothetical protein